MTLLAHAAERRAAGCGAVAAGRSAAAAAGPTAANPPRRRPSDGAVDIACLRLRGAQQQTRRTLLQQSIDGTDGRTDRETDTVPLRRPRGHIGPILSEQTDSALSTATTFTFYKM